MPEYIEYNPFTTATEAIVKPSIRQWKYPRPKPHYYIILPPTSQTRICGFVYHKLNPLLCIRNPMAKSILPPRLTGSTACGRRRRRRHQQRHNKYARMRCECVQNTKAPAVRARQMHTCFCICCIGACSMRGDSFSYVTSRCKRHDIIFDKPTLAFRCVHTMQIDTDNTSAERMCYHCRPDGHDSEWAYNFACSSCS